jgi:antitoxin component of MazEF toxin-antitoxin module
MEAAIVTQKRGILTMRAVEALPVMQITVKEKSGLFVPPSVQRQVGIRHGDRLEFKVSPRTITITTVEPPTYKPTKAELAAIRKGEAEIARGECVAATELLHDLDRHRRKSGAKATRKVSR